MHTNTIHLINVHAKAEGWQIAEQPFQLRMLDGAPPQIARDMVKSRHTMASRMACEFLREHAPSEWELLGIQNPQIQCGALRKSDFADTGTVTVTTRKASGFTVKHEGRTQSGADAFVIEPCPTFPRGRLLVGIRTLIRTLESE